LKNYADSHFLYAGVVKNQDIPLLTLPFLVMESDMDIEFWVEMGMYIAIYITGVLHGCFICRER
jgi:hypothetical protein